MTKSIQKSKQDLNRALLASSQKGEISGDIEIITTGLRPGEKMYEELLISGDEEKTVNKKIFMSKEKFVSNEVFLQLLNSTKEAISENDISKLTSLMEEYVDGFNYEK